LLQILLRIEMALLTLVSTASQTETGCIAAVAHSAYLRLLLATVSNISFGSAYQLKQSNCCINVLDFQRDDAAATAAAVGWGGNILTVSSTNPRAMVNRNDGGSASPLSALRVRQRESQLPLDLHIPAGRVERINETRHLQVLTTVA
jgi:broad specificity phosphatase PhoE